MSIVHVTPGLLDIRAITTFGLHAKPGTDSPIGKFGTGLKYAIATLLRLGCSVELFIGETEYEFFTKSDNFRGMEYEQVYVRKRKGVLSKWRSVQLPFTTEHGKFWEAWQAFRELHSNTLDEGGTTFSVNGAIPVPVANETRFYISGKVYEEAFLERDKVFLPNGLTKREGDASVQVFNEPSKHLYWRGIRVFDLEKPSVYTYNILDDMELTEDRTLKYVWRAQSILAAFVARSKDQKLINAVVSASPEKHFEGRLDWDYAYVSPSEEFQEVIRKKRGRGGYVAPRALAFYDRYAPAPAVTATLRDRIERWAYSSAVPREVAQLLQYLLRCEIKEPSPVSSLDDDIPF